MPASHRTPLVLLLWFALLIRVAAALLLPVNQHSLESLPDQAGYLQIANNFRHGEGFHFIDPRFSADARAVRTPGYPLFIALLGNSPRAVQIAQALIDTSTVLAVYLVAIRFLPHLLALIAAALVAFNPLLIYFSTLILTETLFTSMLMWSVVLLLTLPNLLPGGILLCLSVLLRPSGILLPILVPIAAAFINPTARTILRVPIATTMLLLLILTLFPWALRNRGVLGQWVWTTTNEGASLYDGFNPDATGASDLSSLQTPQFARIRDLNEYDRDQALKQRARQWIRDTWRTNPSRLAELTFSKLARTWSPIPLSQQFSSPFYRTLMLLYYVPFDLVALMGLWQGPLLRRVKLLLLLPALYLTAVHALSVGSIRYRLPAEPALAILAASALLYSVTRPIASEPDSQLL